jgi:hypothetical protein
MPSDPGSTTSRPYTASSRLGRMPCIRTVTGVHTS